MFKRWAIQGLPAVVLRGPKGAETVFRIKRKVMKIKEKVGKISRLQLRQVYRDVFKKS